MESQSRTAGLPGYRYHVYTYAAGAFETRVKPSSCLAQAELPLTPLCLLITIVSLVTQGRTSWEHRCTPVEKNEYGAEGASYEPRWRLLRRWVSMKSGGTGANSERG